jgi:hypothetical protein
MMFRPRLTTAAEAKRNADEAHHALAGQIDAVSKAKEIVEQRARELGDAEIRLRSASTALGQQPGQTCNTITRRKKNGSPYQFQACAKNPATTALSGQLDNAQKDRTTALANVNIANAELKRLQDPKPSEDASRADAALKDALFNSQLHDFTAMVFGIDPLQVTDAQIHTFLRIFVFVPAILAALASTLLAMTAATIHRAPASPDYRLTAEESHRVMQDALGAAAKSMKSRSSARGGEQNASAAA